MRKVLAVLAAAALAGGAWLASLKYEIRNWTDLEQALRGPAPGDARSEALAPVARLSDAVRIASFHIEALDEAKAGRPQVMRRLAEIVRGFEIVAIQGIRARNQDVVPRLVEAVNASGRKYEYVIGPPQGLVPGEEQLAFVFDTAGIEVDRSEVYVVNDPDDLLRHDPLVAWFRVRGPAPEAAFTLTLVNVHVDPHVAEQEVDTLADVFAAVGNDGRGEDDVILLGTFHVDDRYVGRLNDAPGATWAIAAQPTTTRGDAQLDNLVFSRRATNEFAGKAGVLDFLREFNLSLDQAQEISGHLPVWAEFSIYEGGRPGRVAALPALP